MTVEPCGDYIVLTPHSADELRLAACIVEAIRAGGSIAAKCEMGSIELVFDGDESQTTKKKRKART